jgi:PAS domain-containing protein
MDVTTAKQAEEKVRERETELRQILDLTPQVVGVYGPGGERLYANRFGLEYIGIGLEEWRQAHISDRHWLHPDERERIGAIMDSPPTRGLPPLRERPEDIPVLVRYFSDKYAGRMGKQIDEIPAGALRKLMGWH